MLCERKPCRSEWIGKIGLFKRKASGYWQRKWFTSIKQSKSRIWIALSADPYPRTTSARVDAVCDYQALLQFDGSGYYSSGWFKSHNVLPPLRRCAWTSRRLCPYIVRATSRRGLFKTAVIKPQWCRLRNAIRGMCFSPSWTPRSVLSRNAWQGDPLFCSLFQELLSELIFEPILIRNKPLTPELEMIMNFYSDGCTGMAIW